MRSRSEKGFTLIELLVVVAIISLLSSIIMVSLNDARAKARDARRKSDFHQIAVALEMYYDKYGGYPAMGSTATSGTYANTNPYWDSGLNTWNNLFTPLVNEGFMPNVPRDPINTASGAFPWSALPSGQPVGASINRLYHFRSNGTLGGYNANHYLLCTWLENIDDKANLGHQDMLDPFDPSQTIYLHANYHYSIYNYCVGQ